MSNLLRPVVANLFMKGLHAYKHVEQIPKIWWRYVDDVCDLAPRTGGTHIVP